MALITHNLSPGLTAALRRRLEGERTHIYVAGTGPIHPKRFVDLTPEDWRAQLKVLQEACFAARDVAREAIAAGAPGRIVFLVHPPAVRAVDGASAGAVAGAFLTTFAQVAGIEMAARNVTWNVVVAGWTQESAPANLINGIPAGRYATVDEIASAVVYLVSAEAAYVTGAVLAVDGGFVISKAAGGSPLLKPQVPPS